MAALLQERQLSVNALAREVGISQPYLSRALRGVDKKRATPSLIEAIAQALGVPAEHFLEYRRAKVIDLLQHDPELTDAVYDRLLGARPRKNQRRT